MIKIDIKLTFLVIVNQFESFNLACNLMKKH
jgi:hypothetical protein